MKKETVSNDSLKEKIEEKTKAINAGLPDID